MRSFEKSLRRAIWLPALAVASAFAGEPGAVSVSTVHWISDGQPVENASSRLVRTNIGITAQVSTRDLNPDDAVTLWMIVFNDPSQCTNPSPLSACSDPDIGNPAVQADVMYTAGNVVGGSGISSFVGFRMIGDNSGSVFRPLLPPGEQSPGLINPRGAEVHLIVHSHGPVIPEFMPGMIQTFVGGCFDPGPPFSGLYFPEWGPQGPNTCQSMQFAVHKAPH